MIDVVKKCLSSKVTAKAVYDYLMERDNTYMSSKCRTRLEKRYKWISCSLNGSYSPTKSESGFSGNSWLPALIFPLCRDLHYTTRAMIKKNFRQDPLITLEPLNGTIYENAQNLQEALKLNFESTKFRGKCFDGIVDSVSRYGAAITLSQYQHNTKSVRKTVSTPIGPQQMLVPMNKKNVFNYHVHPLNYAQNELIVDPEMSDWRRIIESVPVSTLISEYKRNPEYYIKDAIESVIKKARAEVIQSNDYHADDKTARDLAGTGVDRYIFYSKLWINGNEEDDKDYVIYIIDDRVVRIEENTYEENACPITSFRMRRRPEYWWGNSPNEEVMPHEKFTHILMNMEAQQALQVLERYIFYPKGYVDPDDFFNRHLNGGMIPVEMKDNIQMQNMFFEYQGREKSTGNVDFLLKELKESAQKLNFKPDFLRHGNKGGLANNTATAASQLDEMSDLLETDCLEVFSYDIITLGRLNSMFLKQFLGDSFWIQPDTRMPPQKIYKEQILGDFKENVVSTIHKNDSQKVIRLQNALTQMMNYKGSGDPTWANVNLYRISKNWIRLLDLGVDEDEVLPEQQQMMPGGMPPNALPFPGAQPNRAPGLETGVVNA